MRQSTRSFWMSVASMAAASFAPASALADEAGAGIVVGNAEGPRFATRLALGDAALRRPGAASSGLTSGGVSLLGDYYFGRSLAGLPAPSGFRATSGLIFGPRSFATPSAFAAGGSLANGAPLGSWASMATPDARADLSTVPYLGVGYTGLKPHSGWSYNADLGLVAQSAGGVRSLRTQNLDDTLRDMRLAPLVQLGVSYSY